jgi:hypothetical protein
MARVRRRPNLNASLVLVFRRAESNYPALTVSLRELDPAARYSVESIDDAREKTTKVMSGEEVMGEMELRVGKKGSSLVVRYRPEVGRQ